MYIYEDYAPDHYDEQGLNEFVYRGISKMYLKKYRDAIEDFSTIIGEFSNQDIDFSEWINLPQYIYSAYLNRGESFEFLDEKSKALIDLDHAHNLLAEKIFRKSLYLTKLYID